MQINERDPHEAVMWVEPETRHIRMNVAFMTFFKITVDADSLAAILPIIASGQEDRELIESQITRLIAGAATASAEIRNGLFHYRLLFYYDANDTLITVHCKDLSEIDSLCMQMEDYIEGLIKNSVWLEKSQRELQKRNTELNDELAARELAQELLKQSLDNQKRIIEEMIKTLSFIGAIRDPYTGTHQQRVAILGKAIGTEMKLDDDQIQGIYVAGMLHDIGKISIPSEILSKPGDISEIEKLLIRSHPDMSYEILQKIEFPWPVARIAQQHHERIDGSGYPKGLKGDDILLEARIIGAADVIEAIGSHRPYRAKIGIDYALDELLSRRGIEYEAEIVDVCVSLFREKGFTFDDTGDPRFHE